jgi:hypothetical protein
MSLFLDDNRMIFCTPQTLTEDLFKIENSEDLARQVLGVIKSKFDAVNVFSGLLEGHKRINAFAILGDGYVVCDDLNINHFVGTRDIVAYYDELDVTVNAPKILFELSYSDAPKVWGNGPRLYEVEALIRDKYTINIHANSEEEALAIADKIDVSEWKHPDVLEDAHLNDRRLIRHARWGNLSVKEIE